MAADSAVMVIDASKGVEAQTIKLFKVCVLRHIPIFTFINKLDREAQDPFDLMEDIESVLGIHTCPINWPIGSGKEFKGVYDRQTRHIHAFTENNNGMKADHKDLTMTSPELEYEILIRTCERLVDDIDLLDGASDELDMDLVSKGQLSPVFFGSALNNFGIELFL